MFEGARRKAVPDFANGCVAETADIIVPLPGQLRLDAGGNLQPRPCRPDLQLAPIQKSQSLFQNI